MMLMEKSYPIHESVVSWMQDALAAIYSIYKNNLKGEQLCNVNMFLVMP
ncbi:hypothetical protein XBP1_2570003 [Xenorhabdus bovienii str. puntauvense]|uniref:Uncharacterized protein n=4 Tax=Xenorhabdus bovienii TaxID=40576 RepID=A0A0B6X727_XENBV|nr:hypothetical protein XBFFR1_960003 [Xenorhabdus bovienii str. feltiae France]CDG94299.1 hypothetical protein XBFFL1_400003 [Xenorhabdus bovienii str. feltiae Florida]CDG97350.1 hypothetical protein XBP1_2570003 [Xenorhabdus bovienii str. puntauvense]CDH07999.1 hypothetical protein XBO1_80003 [Xenorhabdus bovienii str. oregonense]CDH26369.1 hypothetical protein XBKB1_610008 [Xenorhabdus bovienii str. kraussei Becker Underwood]CDM88508.1 protein of unknown function [Xenorhabdus bovienii]